MGWSRLRGHAGGRTGWTGQGRTGLPTSERKKEKKERITGKTGGTRQGGTAVRGRSRCKAEKRMSQQRDAEDNGAN